MEQNIFKRRISEMLYIKRTKSNLNKMEDVQNLSKIYEPILNKVSS